MVTVTGNLRVITGATITAGTVTARLVNFGGSGVPYVTGTGEIIVKTASSVDSDVNGDFSITLLGNDVITPINTYYEFSYQAAHSSEIIGPESYILSGSITLTPITTPPATVAGFPYDVAIFFPDKPGSSTLLTRIPFSRSVIFPAGLTTSRGTAVSAATADATFSVQKNDTQFGTATFHSNGTVSFVASTLTAFHAGDVFSVVAPVSVDATLADIGLMIGGTRS